MIARLISEQATERHIRPFNPYRDLGQLADLIEATFGGDLALTGSRMVHDMRQLALWGPMLSLSQRIAPLLTGFVWYEGDRLIGNASLTRDAHSDTYSLSNVAVRPEHRARGIAGSLVDAAIDRAESSGAKRLLLQVRPDNQTAIALYRHRGFERYDTLHEVNLRPGSWPMTVGPRVSGLRRVRASDSRQLYDLAVSSTPRSLAEKSLLRRHAGIATHFGPKSGFQKAPSSHPGSKKALGEGRSPTNVQRVGFPARPLERLSCGILFKLAPSDAASDGSLGSISSSCLMGRNKPRWWRPRKIVSWALGVPPRACGVARTSSSSTSLMTTAALGRCTSCTSFFASSPTAHAIA